LEFLTEYGIFLAKTITWVVAILVVFGSIFSMAQSQKKAGKGHLDITHLNKSLEKMREALEHAVLDKASQKKAQKIQKKKEKAEQKDRSKSAEAGESRKRLYVLEFEGDIKASGVASLREEISAILAQARPEDEVVVKLTSGGGMVHSYGLASSQLSRITDSKIPLTVCVDKVAASGGYMMACVADRIIAAPFAILGSIGVLAQIPNFHRLLQKNDIDFEQLTAGEYKRTMSIFGENTDKGREKFMEELEDTHTLFKAFVNEHRPVVNIEEVATGEVWFGRRALEHKLVDELATSDAYLVKACESADVYEVKYMEKKRLQDKLSMAAHSVLDRLILTWWERLTQHRFFT